MKKIIIIMFILIFIFIFITFKMFLVENIGDLHTADNIATNTKYLPGSNNIPVAFRITYSDITEKTDKLFLIKINEAERMANFKYNCNITIGGALIYLTDEDGFTLFRIKLSNKIESNKSIKLNKGDYILHLVLEKGSGMCNIDWEDNK